MKNIKKNEMDEKRIPFFWVRDASGHRSVSVTLLVVSFFVTTVAYVLSIFHSIGPIEIRSFDVAACSTYMVPILTLYFSRRWTDAKHGITHLREAAQSANTPLVQPPMDPNYGPQYGSGFPHSNYPQYPQYGQQPAQSQFVPPVDGQ